MTTELQLTGERTLPDIPRENYWFQRHLAAYEIAAGLARGRRVLDIGCGEGYGPALMAEVASRVVGVDVAPEVIRHASESYRKPNLSFSVMEAGGLEFRTGSFDVAVSMQVVEHLRDESGYFTEMARVLAPGGLALVTTPNRLTISPGSDVPVNPFHLREYTPGELAERLGGYFENVRITGLFHRGWLAWNDRLRFVDFVKFYNMGRRNPRYWTHRLLAPRVKVSGFMSRDSGLDRCLDIIALCRKGRRL